MQIRQLAGMRGLVANPKGEIIPRPIKSNFREGLSVLEYFISTHGARKGLADTALRTADSGYLTRRLVDVAQELIIREEDCGSDRSIPVQVNVVRARRRPPSRRRTSRHSTLRPRAGRGREGRQQEDRLSRATSSPTSWRAIGRRLRRRSRPRPFGHHVRGRGRRLPALLRTDLATGRLVDIGEAVGIIAAQSIGEPGTQLTMRTFHTGGVAGEDITHGLPRVVELFEARKPKGEAQITELSGTVSIEDDDEKHVRRIRVTDETRRHGRVPGLASGPGSPSPTATPSRSGQQLPRARSTRTRSSGSKASRRCSCTWSRRSSRSTGQPGRDDPRQAHRADRSPDAPQGAHHRAGRHRRSCPATWSTRRVFEETNAEVVENGGEPASARPVLLGITKASLATDSWLSAASFQETTRVLTDAAIGARSDPLLGLKENVIIGKLIPAGTGMAAVPQRAGPDQARGDPGVLARPPARDPGGRAESGTGEPALVGLTREQAESHARGRLAGPTRSSRTGVDPVRAAVLL